MLCPLNPPPGGESGVNGERKTASDPFYSYRIPSLPLSLLQKDPFQTIPQLPFQHFCILCLQIQLAQRGGEKIGGSGISLFFKRWKGDGQLNSAGFYSK